MAAAGALITGCSSDEDKSGADTTEPSVTTPPPVTGPTQGEMPKYANAYGWADSRARCVLFDPAVLLVATKESHFAVCRRGDGSHYLRAIVPGVSEDVTAEPLDIDFDRVRFTVKETTVDVARTTVTILHPVPGAAPRKEEQPVWEYWSAITIN